jgi:hypothetical protein
MFKTYMFLLYVSSVQYTNLRSKQKFFYITITRYLDIMQT